MKKVLIVASHFPPNATGGVMRVAKLVKYLGRYDWQAVVVTSSATTSSTELNKDVSAVRAVYRLPALDIRKAFAFAKSTAQWLKGIVKPKAANKAVDSSQPNTAQAPVARRGSLAQRFCVPDYMFLWTPLAVLAGVYAVKKHKIDVIFSTSPLPSANSVSYWIKKLTGVRWVLDMRDPWTTNPMAEPRYNAFLSKMDQRLERRALKSADDVVVVSEPFIDPICERFTEVSRDKFHVIPNGFDPDDFINIEAKHFDKLTIAHCGSFYETRSAMPFLTALRVLLDKFPELEQQLTVKFVGEAGVEASNGIKTLGLDNVVEKVGMVNHKTSLQYVAGADILLLVPGPGKSTMTGKVFEYLAVKKPILALAGEGALRSLLSDSKTAVLVEPTDVAGIEAAIESFVQQYQQNGTIALKDANYRQIEQQFCRRHTAQRIAGLLDKHHSERQA
ncbi:MAG: hypothetical protein CMK65_01130 [Pseudoalteromonas sp.]|uniref:glycosyltransferase n=1 Tax=Pseudoalteromonas sp. TaxID=53249 RepID=UPI000C910BA8|nr:glycosyltransferase [Pseudoalteromonas sp.]MAD02217.1 hypothetical protein [Pseudoalteromonas sp.]|tara:strand:+ start:73657 stop:74994 length:1338 start_codon:yes stop_codon:yes gene_type:complete